MTRLTRGLALIGALAFTCSASLGVTFASPASAAAPSTGSAVTVSGKGEFKALKVKVAQTKNLLDQVVEISWSGGQQTKPGSGQYSINYLQIMQCWGESSKGPDREQCQFGGFSGDQRGGAQTASRQVNYGSTLTDPLETIKPTAGSFKNAYVPFRSVTGKSSTDGVSEFFDGSSTNEVPYAQTRTDGTGQDFFSIQTVKDAPGLGCGEPVTKSGRTTGRSCWLVVVPRDNHEVDGSERTISGNQLISSPLSATNWSHRLVVPLQFEPVGRPCPLGKAERKTTGQEIVTEAVLRWQPALCAGNGAVYGFSQVGEDAARRELKTADPGLVFVSKPLLPAANPDRLPVLYAPVALAGLTVAFNVESQSVFRAPAAIKERDGQRITQLRLTPRLVAKLLTQTYTRAVDVEAKSVEGNPTDLTQDKEFQAINPKFDGLRISLPDLLLPLGQSDVTEQVWDWLLTDEDAKAFLAGKSDEFGTRLNPNYKGMELPRSDFPKSDPFCRTYLDDRLPQCTLDAHPYANDQHEAARASARGDTLVKAVWDGTAVPPAWKKGPNQPSGYRGMLAIVDTASAERYGLETAELRNASGAFVAPTTTSLRAAAALMTRSVVPAVLQPAPSAKSAAAYPLAALSYAATVPSVLDTAARKEYATFLRYAAKEGQVPGVKPGELPYGYAPLPAKFRAQTLAAATALLAGKGSPTAQDPEGDGTESTDGAPTGTNGSSSDSPTDGTTSATGTPAGGVGTSDPSSATLVALATPVDSAGLGRLVPIAALTLGVLAACAGPVLIRLSRRPATAAS